MQNEMQNGFFGAQCLCGLRGCDTGESNPDKKRRRIQCFRAFSGLFSAFILHFSESWKPRNCAIWSFITNKMQNEMQNEIRPQVQKIDAPFDAPMYLFFEVKIKKARRPERRPALNGRKIPLL